AKISGTGLSPDDMQAQLQATIHLFEYQQYPYRNIKIEGEADRQHYIAQASMNDENLAFELEGDVNMNQEIPHYQLVLDIEKAFLQPLNLTQEELSLKAALDVDLQMDSPDNINGEVGLRDV